MVQTILILFRLFSPYFLPPVVRKVHCSIRLDIGKHWFVKQVFVACLLCAGRFSWHSGRAINMLALLASGVKEHSSSSLTEPWGRWMHNCTAKEYALEFHLSCVRALVLVSLASYFFFSGLSSLSVGIRRNRNTFILKLFPFSACKPVPHKWKKFLACGSGIEVKQK